MTLLLALLLLFQEHPTGPGKNPTGNDPDDPSIRQELKGDVDVAKDGTVTIPFFPPFARTPSCSITQGEVVADSPEWIKLRKIKAKKVHYECHGIKK